jgi:hypothetical protein
MYILSWPSLDQNLAVSLQVYTKVEVRTIAMHTICYVCMVVLCLRCSLFALLFTERYNCPLSHAHQGLSSFLQLSILVCNYLIVS